LFLLRTSAIDFIFLLRASAIQASLMALILASVQASLMALGLASVQTSLTLLSLLLRLSFALPQSRLGIVELRSSSFAPRPFKQA
ncbi:MAG: hypothetical protein K6B45_11305, partial [Bacteroidaceae bacterium]|nr:hypothetical protein [Bacteroidaceae bacterium]